MSAKMVSLLQLCAVLLSVTAAQAMVDSLAITDYMNTVRGRLENGANIEQLEWNSELAVLAQAHADDCSLQGNFNRETDSYVTAEIGENINVTRSTGVTDSTAYVQAVIDYWESLGINYEFDTNVLKNTTANLYTQLMWATTSQVGCGRSVCTVHRNEYHFLVCNFYPSGNEFGTRPFVKGEPCSLCPSNKPLCQDNLCVAEPSRADPNFSVRLASGQLLCFSVQGEAGSNFNLISAGTLQVNAIYVNRQNAPHDALLGAIEVKHEGRHLVLNITSNKIYVDSDVKLDFKQVQRVTLVHDKLSLSMIGNLGRPSNDVAIAVEGLSFEFVLTNSHLDVIVSNFKEHMEHYNGLLGQFLELGVSIDEDQKLLNLPGRSPLPIEEQPLSSFVKVHSTLYQDSKCWSAVKEVSNVVDGVFMDYDVGNLLAPSGVQFGAANLTN